MSRKNPKRKYRPDLSPEYRDKVLALQKRWALLTQGDVIEKAIQQACRPDQAEAALKAAAKERDELQQKFQAMRGLRDEAVRERDERQQRFHQMENSRDAIARERDALENKNKVFASERNDAIAKQNRSDHLLAEAEKATAAWQRDKEVLTKQLADRQGLADDRREEMDKMLAEIEELKRKKVQLEADLSSSAERADETERALRQKNEELETDIADITAVADELEVDVSSAGRRGWWLGLALGATLGAGSLLWATALWG